MVFYLKVNRLESYTYKNLQHWMNAICRLDESKIYILCDDNSLKQNIINRVNFADCDVNFLPSCRLAEELADIVSKITDEKWENAGYAHLTTFWHACQNHYRDFWNIDADDTFLCLPPERICQMLNHVEVAANEREIKAFSLDMWRSREPEHWTFGITYIDNTVDWLGEMKKYSTDIESGKHIHREKNVDSFFTYLKMRTCIRIETFYFENLKFIHYSNDFFRRSIVSGFFHWREGKLCLPILYYCFGMKSLGLLKIAEDVMKLDIHITEQESNDFLYANSMDCHLIKEYQDRQYESEKCGSR